MDNEEARSSFLSLHRRGESYPEDSRFTEAERRAANDGELVPWWKREQELDDAIAAKLQSTHIPAGLKERLTASPVRPSVVRPAWSRAVLAAAAAIALAAAFFSSWSGPFQPAASLAEFRDEMVSFIELDPTLAVSSAELPRIKEFLATADAPSKWQVPPKLQGAEPLGCRVLRFRGHDVSLICFEAEGGKLVHLFVTDAAALPRAQVPKAPSFAPEGEWMTASWTDGENVYVLTSKGDHTAVEKFFATS